MALAVCVSVMMAVGCRAVVYAASGNDYGDCARLELEQAGGRRSQQATQVLRGYSTMAVGARCGAEERGWSMQRHSGGGRCGRASERARRGDKGIREPRPAGSR
jgi:hypothetical protein